MMQVICSLSVPQNAAPVLGAGTLRDRIELCEFRDVVEMRDVLSEQRDLKGNDDIVTVRLSKVERDKALTGIVDERASFQRVLALRSDDDLGHGDSPFTGSDS